MEEEKEEDGVQSQTLQFSKDTSQMILFQGKKFDSVTEIGNNALGRAGEFPSELYFCGRCALLVESLYLTNDLLCNDFLSKFDQLTFQNKAQKEALTLQKLQNLYKSNNNKKESDLPEGLDFLKANLIVGID